MSNIHLILVFQMKLHTITYSLLAILLNFSQKEIWKASILYFNVFWQEFANCVKNDKFDETLIKSWKSILSRKMMDFLDECHFAEHFSIRRALWSCLFALFEPSGIKIAPKIEKPRLWSGYFYIYFTSWKIPRAINEHLRWQASIWKSLKNKNSNL